MTTLSQTPAAPRALSRYAICLEGIVWREWLRFLGQRVWHMAFTPDEKYLLTTNGISNDVSVIDVGALKVVKTIEVGELPWGIAVSAR